MNHRTDCLLLLFTPSVWKDPKHLAMFENHTMALNFQGSNRSEISLKKPLSAGIFRTTLKRGLSIPL
jgi:hypothetical protein